MTITPIPLPKGFQRLGNFALDSTSVFTTLGELEMYASSNASAYAGQVLGLSGTVGTVYVINNDMTVTLIGSGGGTPNPSIQADDAILQGQPVYIKSNGHIGLAKADALNTSKVVGFAVNDTAISYACEYQRNIITLTDWSNVVGTTNLTVNNTYFLDAVTAGKISNTSPSIGVTIVVGEAISTTSLEINIQYPILL